MPGLESVYRLHSSVSSLPSSSYASDAGSLDRVSFTTGNSVSFTSQVVDDEALKAIPDQTGV